jgi:hypothetical protein
MLCKDPLRRPTIREILERDFIRNRVEEYLDENSPFARQGETRSNTQGETKSGNNRKDRERRKKDT